MLLRTVFWFSVTIIISSLIFSSCNRAKNYKDALIVTINNKYFIKLKGKRNLMVHDPISLLIGKTYEDSTLIPLPYLRNGVIKGSEIVLGEGNYQYTLNGNVLIDHKMLKVGLHYDDTIKNTVEQFVWNGDYNLINN